jgi:hypothetical protein
MHGPRLSGGGGRRGRRKTVTFDERCDVVEFDREETDEEASDNDEYGDDGDGLNQEHHHFSEEDPFFIGGAQGHMENPMHERDENTSYESIDLSDTDVRINNSPMSFPMTLGPDASISGLVDEMLFSSNAANVDNPNLTLGMKQSHLISDDEDVDGLLRQVIADNPTNLETDDVFAGALHSDRFFRHHQRPHLPSPPTHASPHRWTPPQHSSPHQHHLPESHQLSHPTVAAPQRPSPTPPRRKRAPTAAELPSIVEDSSPDVANASPNHRSPPHLDVDYENSATPPYGGSTPLDKARRARQENDYIDVEMLLETPPRNADLAADAGRAEGLVSRYEHQSKLRGSFVLFSLSHFGQDIHHTLHRSLGCSTRRK